MFSTLSARLFFVGWPVAIMESVAVAHLFATVHYTLALVFITHFVLEVNSDLGFNDDPSIDIMLSSAAFCVTASLYQYLLWL